MEQDEIIRKFTLLKRRQYFLIPIFCILFGTSIYLNLTMSGLIGFVFFVLSLAGIIAVAVYSALKWYCPLCNTRLNGKRIFSPTFCPYCGVRLQQSN